MAVRVRRFDSGTMSKAERTPQGYLRAPALATRTGVFYYRMPDGTTRRELRHPDDVFDPKSMATLAGVPVTDDHPNMKNPSVQLLDSTNTKDFMVGYTGDLVAKEDKNLATAVTITDAGVIQKVEAGKQELSCGYTCEHEAVPGVFDGEAYDVRQRGITYNHLAIVDRGRAGPNISLQLDSADAVQVDPCKPLEDKEMEKIKINGVEYDVSSPIAKAYMAEQKANCDAADKLKADKDAADAKATEQATRADKAEARADGLKAELDKSKADLAAKSDAADPAKIRAAAKELARIEGVARRVLDKDTVAKLDTMDEKAIKVAVIKAERPSVNLDGKSEAYIDASFDGIAEALGEDKGGGLGKTLAESRLDGAKDGDAEEACKRQTERTLNAWKPTGTDGGKK